MQPAVWIAIYLPIFIMFFVIIPAQKRVIFKKNNHKKKRGSLKMSNELLKKYVGKVCNISAGYYGATYNKVKILELVDNWMRVESKGKESLINTEYIQSVRIIS